MRRRASIFLIFNALLLSMFSPAFSQQQSTVVMQDSFFEPETITVKAGDSIVFDNTGRLPHTATSKDKSWDTGNVNAGQTKTITFSQAGSFEYICVYHEVLGMIGTVVVENGDAPSEPEFLPPADYLVAGRIEEAEPIPPLGPRVFAVAGILAALALGGFGLYRAGKTRS